MDPASARPLVGGSVLEYTLGEIRSYIGEIRGRVSNAASRGHFEAGDCLRFPDSNHCNFLAREKDYQSVMTRRDIPIVQARAENGTSHGRMENTVAYMGLLDYGYFSVGHDERYLGRDEEIFGSDISWADGQSVCCEQSKVSIATGRWEGVMIGMDKSETVTRGHIVQGDADIVVTLTGMAYGRPASSDPYSERNVEVEFSKIFDLNNGNQHPNIVGDYIMSPASATFGSHLSETPISGSFAGPNNENVLGLFETSNLIGSFGGKKVN